jgi:hypothetical protein
MRQIFITTVDDLPTKAGSYIAKRKTKEHPSWHAYKGEEYNEIWYRTIEWYLIEVDEPLPQTEISDDPDVGIKAMKFEKENKNVNRYAAFIAGYNSCKEWMRSQLSRIEPEKENDPKMKDKSYMKFSCFDLDNDLWANVNCANHIDPATCSRETSCIICDKYVPNQLKEHPVSEPTIDINTPFFGNTGAKVPVSEPESIKSAEEMLKNGINDGSYADILDTINPDMATPFLMAVCCFAEDFASQFKSGGK